MANRHYTARAVRKKWDGLSEGQRKKAMVFRRLGFDKETAMALAESPKTLKKKRW